MTRSTLAFAAFVALVGGLVIGVLVADGPVRGADRRETQASAPARGAIDFPAGRGLSAQGAERPFYFLMAYSGTRFGGALHADTEYAAYQSRTVRTGVTVPVLYMRTTRGRSNDWVFDPAFDVGIKCRDGRVADDALDEIVANAIAKRLPTMFVLNGGIWADASCDTPEWDLNDHLEQSEANCQWSQDDRVFPDDHLRGLTGSIDSPQLARSLTYNVYATEVRAYKRRNLAAAASRIAVFAREHPDLFVGVTLDADTYMNPFFNGEQWFDYNPDTIRQFRHWLRGSGPYAGETAGELPDLRSFRRARPLTLAEVNRLAGRRWTSWAEVDPPRRFPGSPRDALGPRDIAYWDDPWFAEWDVFRKHLVALHYEDLATWTTEAGIGADRVFTAQGFHAPFGRNRPFALRVTSTGQNYDSAGMSLEGAKPRNGHLGAILYGKAAENDIVTENGRSLFWNFASVDPGWGIVELNTATLNRPEIVPTYANAYRAFRDAFNFDAALVTVMAWNGPRGSEAGNPGFRPHTAWRETVAEQAMLDFAVSHANVPRGSRLWTFGTPGFASDDGWRAGEGGALHAKGGSLIVEQQAAVVELLSPRDQLIRPRVHKTLLVDLRDAAGVESLEVQARMDAGDEWAMLAQRRIDPGGGRTAVALDWPVHAASASATASQLRIAFTAGRAPGSFAIHRIALLPG